MLSMIYIYIYIYIYIIYYIYIYIYIYIYMQGSLWVGPYYLHTQDHIGHSATYTHLYTLYIMYTIFGHGYSSNYNYNIWL